MQQFDLTDPGEKKVEYLDLERAISFMRRVTSVVKVLQTIDGHEKGKDYGYCALASSFDRRILLSFQFGKCPSGKPSVYDSFSREKVRRLYVHAKRDGHISSWQSRNEQMKQYGGAVLAHRAGLILSASSMPELEDEALMLVSGYSEGIMTIQEILDVAKTSDNKIFYALYTAYCKPMRYANLSSSSNPVCVAPSPLTD